MKCPWPCRLAFIILTTSHSAFAGVANVVHATAVCNPESTCDFMVTVQHGDSGWDHYANQWEILSLTGEVLGVRVLHHPHVNEQPFTRSLTGVTVSPSIEKVKIRARDSIHGYGGEEMVIEVVR